MPTAYKVFCYIVISAAAFSSVAFYFMYADALNSAGQPTSPDVCWIVGHTQYDTIYACH